MARYYADKKIIAEDTLKLSISLLRKEGLLSTAMAADIKWANSQRPSAGEGNGLRVTSSISASNGRMIHLAYGLLEGDFGGIRQISYGIKLTSTPCTFGGDRYWFVCPGQKGERECGRRVGTIYKAKGDYFICRHCNNLSYQSRNENRRNEFFAFYKLLNAR